MPDNGITVEQIQIKINQESTNALKGIESLATALQGLKTVTTGGIKGLTTIANQLNKLNNAISGLPDLSHLEQLNNVLTKLKDVGEINIRQTVSTLGSGKTASQLEQLNEEAEKVMHGVGERVEEALDETKDAFSGTGGTEAFSEVNDTVDVTVDKIENLNALIALQKEKIIELRDSLDALMSDDDADDSKILNLETQIERAKKSLLSLENELTKALTSANVGGSGGISNGISERFTELSDRFTTLQAEINSSVDKLNTALGEKSAFSDNSKYISASTFADNLSMKLENLNNQMSELRSQFVQMQNAETAPSEGEWASFENRVRSVVIQIRSLKGQCDKTTEAINNISEAAEDASKSTNSFVSKFTASLKRISLYRIVRALLKQIASAISEGIQNYAQYSEEANEAISELKSVWQQLSNTLGVTVTQLLILISPLLQTLCDMLIDVVNGVNYFLAVISGKESYSKAIKQTTDYADSLNEVQNSLLGIDEINKLSDNDSVDYSSMFEEVDVVSISSSWTDTLAIVTALITALTAFAGSGVLSTITSLWTKFTTKLKSLSTVAKAATTVAALALEFYTCYENLYQVFKGTQDWEDALSTLIPVIAAVSVVLVALYGKVGIILAVVTAVSAAVAAWTTAQDELRAEICSAAFWDSLNRYGTSLDDLCSYMERTYSWTTTLAEATAEWQSEEEALIEDLSSSLSVFTQYNTKLQATGQLTEKEATAMTEALSQMVDDMKAIVEGSKEQVWDVFEALFQDASKDFINQLGNMKEAFEEFMGIFNDSVTDAEQQIEDLIEKSAGEGLTDEEKQTLQTLTDYVTDLANITVTINSANFENTVSSLEELLAEGINISDTEELESFLSDLSTYATGYKEDLKASYEEAVESINYYQKLVDTMYKYKQIDSETYDYYSQVFDDALDTLEEGYKDNVAAIDSDVQSILDQIQTEIATSITVSAVEGLNNKGWWETYQRGTISGAEEGYSQASEMIEAINSVIEALGYDSSVSWLDQWYEETVGEYDGALSVLENIWDFLGYGGGVNSKDNYNDAVEILQSMTEWLENNGYINGYATGGLPESGELFMARENGIPEMVGSWGSNHSAVANNEQIVEGIKQGVYEAMVEAGSAGGDGGNITVQFVSSGQVKSEQIITAAERRNRRDGKKVIAVEV